MTWNPYFVARKALYFKRGKWKCSCIGEQILPTRINNNHKKLICVSPTIHDFSVWNKPLINTCQYCSTSWANQVLCSLGNACFQNRGVCLRAFPSFLPSPYPCFQYLALVHFLRSQSWESCSSGLSFLRTDSTLALQATQETRSW